MFRYEEGRGSLRNQVRMRASVSLLAFCRCCLLTICFALEQNIVLKIILFTSLYQNTRNFQMKSKKSMTVLLNLHVTQFKSVNDIDVY